jgi:hypothetical protein
LIVKSIREDHKMVTIDKLNRDNRPDWKKEDDKPEPLSEPRKLTRREEIEQQLDLEQDITNMENYPD